MLIERVVCSWKVVAKAAPQQSSYWEARSDFQGKLHVTRPLRWSQTYGVRSKLRRRLQTWQVLAQASSDSPSDPSPSSQQPPNLDWRQFRARLVAQTATEKETAAPQELWGQRVSSANLELLKKQNPELAKEQVWAHPTGGPEVGGVLLAAGDLALGVEQRYWQAVVLLVEHGPRGSWGLLLNRPSGYSIQTVSLLACYTHSYTQSHCCLLRSHRQLWVCWPPRQAGARAHNEALASFLGNAIYVGGHKSDGKTLYFLHSHKLPGAEEIIPGVYMGGLDAAAQGVQEGRFPASEFRFFVGRVEWLPGGLLAEVGKGLWYTGACSRNLVIKQCLQLPKPLWREILELMGGEYAEVSRKAYEER